MGISQRKAAERLFQQAADLPPDKRASFLDDQSGLDLEVRQEVEQLLRRLDHAMVPSLNKIDTSGPKLEEHLEGSRIGPYRIIKRIGEGGFGSVYKAEQTEPISRIVALKVIKPGMDTRQVIARFEAERQALARMNHPHIAQVYEAGATDKGRPFFAMELVEGLSLTEYCDRNRLPIPERIELFIQVCHAVQHAHQKGIIHRDLKPTNILVKLLDGVPVPKVIDFGIARATDRSLTEATLMTISGQIMGTPQYMSPEQAMQGGIDVDTRTDIYSLGVLLYELLAGTTPFTAETFRSTEATGIQKIIIERIPVRPSARVAGLNESKAKVAGVRGLEPRALERLLKGEPDWIVMKALEKDRERRYETANSLAEDARRFLNREPVQATPPSRIYLLRKLVSRHRTAFAILAVFFLLIVGFAGSMSMLYSRAEKERQEALAARDAEEEQRQRAEMLLQRAQEAETRAVAETATAKRISSFLESIFETSTPGKEKAEEITAREILDRGAERIKNELKDEPESQAVLLHVIGRVYMNLGLYERAAPMLTLAYEVRRDRLGEESPNALYSMIYLGRLLMLQDSLGKAEALLRDALASARRVFGDRDHATLKALKYLSWVLFKQGKWERAEPLAREALETSLAILGENSADTVGCMQTLSWVLLKRDKKEEAESLNRRACALSIELHGLDDVTAANAWNNLGGMLFELGRKEEAETLMRKALDTRIRHLGEDHRLVLESKANLAEVLHGMDRNGEAEDLLRDALTRSQNLTDRDAAGLRFSTMLKLARVLVRLDRTDEARKMVQRCIGLYPAARPDEEERATFNELCERFDLNVSDAVSEGSSSLREEPSTPTERE